MYTQQTSYSLWVSDQIQVSGNLKRTSGSGVWFCSETDCDSETGAPPRVLSPSKSSCTNTKQKMIVKYSLQPSTCEHNNAFIVLSQSAAEDPLQ